MSSADWGPPEPYPGPPRYEGGRPPAWAAPPTWGSPHPGPWGPPPAWGQPAWGQPTWGQPTWGQAAWGQPEPARPRRPGTVVAAAVAGYLSSVLVLLGTVYGLALTGLLSLAHQLPLGFGPGMAVLHLALVALLVVGATRALGMRRRWLLGALVLQLTLAFWWRHALGGVTDLVADGGLRQVPWVFGALAVVAAGLAYAPDLGRWGGSALARRRERQGGA